MLKYTVYSKFILKDDCSNTGFIGSCLVKKLNDLGHKDLILVDDFIAESKRNLINKSYFQKIPRSIFFDWLRKTR